MSASLADRASQFTFERFSTAIFFLALMLAACLMPAQTDTWWQLRTGEEMWRSHHVMLHDEFSHTVAGGYWPNHEWLAQAVFYAAYRVGGLPLLTALCAAAVTLAWAIVASLTPGSRFTRLLLLGAGAVMSSPAWSLRPQVFSLALVAVTLWILVRRRWLWSLPVLFLVWANLHGAVALGGIIIAAAIVTTLLVNREQFRTMALVAVACLLATAATPLGFSLWKEVPASLARLHSYGVLEWQPPGLAIADAPFWIAALAIVVLLFINRARLLTSWSLTLLGAAALLFLALTLQTRRNIPTFMLCAVPLIGTLLNQPRRQRATTRVERPMLNAITLATMAVIGVLLVGHAWSQPVPRLGWTPVADDLRRAVTGCPGRLYNRYDDGGYLIWFARDKKVFMDSRQDPYPEDIVHGHIQLESSGDYKAIFARYDIGCALTTSGSPLAAHLERDGWQRKSGAGSWVVFTRPAASELVAVPANRTESE
jgi:predicted RNA binding protein YcfA (HicA-like mRNA interferase family)